MMRRLRGWMHTVRLVGSTLRGSLATDALVCTFVGGVVAFVVGMVLAPHVDAASFLARATYEDRVRLPVTGELNLTASDQLPALEILSVTVMKVTDPDAGRAVSPEQVDTRWSASVTMLVVGDDLSLLPRWFGSNVPSDPGEGVLLDRSSTDMLNVKPGDRIALALPFITPELDEAVALELTAITARTRMPLDRSSRAVY